MARFRAVLAEIEPLPALTAARPAPDGKALLAQARDLLTEVWKAAAQRDDIAPVHESAIHVGTQVSVQYTWPEPLRQTVQMVEALMGAAWPPAPLIESTTESAFFSRSYSLRDGVPNGRKRHPTTHACTILALQWLRCAERLEPAVVVREPDTAWNLPLDPHEPLLARKLTGMLRGPSGSPLAVPVERPIVLTDSLADRARKRAVVGYPVSRGAVCLTPHSRDRFLVTPDGSIEPLPEWPRTAVDEVSFGSDGAIAWSNGLAQWPDHAEPAYVMYRREANGPVMIEELSIRPTIGAWWKGRLYWNCYPTPIPTWIGMASWVPGEEPRREMPDVTAFGVMPDENGLVLDPCIFHPQLGWEHRSFTHAWHWKPGQPLAAIPHGPEGPSSALAECEGWTAVAHPDADLVRFESADGHRVSMTCYYPMRVAWTGRSLLVSTAERDLLFFDGLLDRLQSLQMTAR
jgi:hypothetical protein